MYVDWPFYLVKLVIAMNRLEHIITMLDKSLGSKSKRHITGGVLVSVALLFGGLAFTVMTLKTEDKNTNE